MLGLRLKAQYQDWIVPANTGSSRETSFDDYLLNARIVVYELFKMSESRKGRKDIDLSVQTDLSLDRDGQSRVAPRERGEKIRDRFRIVAPPTKGDRRLRRFTLRKWFRRTRPRVDEIKAAPWRQTERYVAFHLRRFLGF